MQSKLQKKEIMTLELFKEKFEEIKKQGWVETKKIENKNGGAGNTLESLLGIQENNLKTPDLGEIELKTTKKPESGTITLFTYDNGLWKIPQAEYVKYGRWIPEKGRFDSYFIHSPNKTIKEGIITTLDSIGLKIYTPDKKLAFDFSYEEMAKRWNEKVQQVILVNFEERKNSKNIREYNFKSFKLHVGKMTKEIIKESWEEGLLCLETSMHKYPNKAVRNHGTKLRAEQKDLDVIYKKTSR